MKLDSPAVFITARTKSSRLPEKCLLEINGKKIIEHIIERAKLIQNSHKIILCTTLEESDNILCEIAEQHNISYFRGSTIDKLDRWYRATKEFKVSHFVTFFDTIPWWNEVTTRCSTSYQIEIPSHLIIWVS